MANYEYKTVALPRSVAKRRRRRQTEADLVAEQLGKTLNDEAIDGWEYVRAETLTTPGQRGLVKQAVPAAYVVLIFKRSRESVWQRHAEAANPQDAMPAREPTPASQPQPMVAPAPAPTPQNTPPAAAPVPPQPEVQQFGSTSIQLISNADGGSVTPIRPPLGSAQD